MLPIELRSGLSIEHPIVNFHLEQILRSPASIIGGVRKCGGRMVFFNGQLTENPELQTLAGIRVPGREDGATWDCVGGIFHPDIKAGFVGVEGEYDTRGFEARTGIHEFAHLVSYLLGTEMYGTPLASTPRFKRIRKQQMPYLVHQARNVPGFAKYHEDAEEFFGLSYELYFGDIYTGEGLCPFPGTHRYFRCLARDAQRRGWGAARPLLREAGFEPA